MSKGVKILAGTALVVALVVLMGGVGSVRAQDDSCVIWGRVYIDADRDGQYDVGETRLSGVTVTLLDDSEDEVDTYVTGYSGLYEFTVTDDDTYYVVETDPPGYTSNSPNRLEVAGEPGERIWAGDFADVPAEVPPPTPMCTLSARVFIDYRGDGVFQAGVDIPLGDVPVTLSFPDGTSEVLETTSFGMVNFPGFDAAGGVTVSVELPERYGGYALASGPNGSTSIELQPDDFHFNYAYVQFKAEIVGEAAGP